MKLLELSASEISWCLPPFSPAPADDDPLVAAMLEVLAYRLVMTQALTTLHEQQRHLTILQDHNRRLRDEYQHLRAQTMRAATR